MNRHRFWPFFLALFAAELAALLSFARWEADDAQDAVLVNDAVQTVQADWEEMGRHKNRTRLDYVVIDLDGNVLFQTRPGLSRSVNEAVRHWDMAMDVAVGGAVVGKVLIHNDSARLFWDRKEKTTLFLAGAVVLQCIACIGYFFYVSQAIQKPFRRLKGFAERIAGGNLDIPLEMDRQNVFGAFTESFDMMRSELKKARRAEAEANACKRELVAKLSHDIKTPVASIQAASEVGAALAADERARESYTQIMQKAGQINALVTNLFASALEELEQLSVSPAELDGRTIKTLLQQADYLHRAAIPAVPACRVSADGLRLQQVFDNLFSNSYKYAGTGIEVTAAKEGRFLAVSIEDYGGGVSDSELPLLKQKFVRGKNAKSADGAGLGLFISDSFMKGMGGELSVENGARGLKVTVRVALSGSSQ